MHHLVPHFIVERLQQNELHGSFEAATLFIDIVGFTALTEALMSDDKAGAERLATVINTLYDPIVGAVHAYGGFVAGFAGDALLAVFPGSRAQSLASTVQAATAARSAFLHHGRFDFQGHSFQLTLRGGSSFGDIEWGIVGDARHKNWYLRGQAIVNATAKRLTADDLLKTLEQAATQALMHAPSPPRLNPPASVLPTAVPPDLAAHFYPLALWTRPWVGEFRQVVTLFIGVEDNRPWEELNQFATEVMHLTRQYGGLFVELDHSDKGMVMLIYVGAPVAHDNSVERTLDLVLALQRSTQTTIPWRAAITHGPCYAGYLGTTTRAKYAVLGSTINLAARLLERTTWSQILVANDICLQAGYRFNLLGEAGYRGYTKPVTTAELVGEARPPRDFSHPLMGRQRELEQLLTWVRPLQHGRAPDTPTALILAEPGIGKSHLAAVLERDQPPSYRWLTGQTNQIVPRAFGPFIDILRDLCKQDEQVNKATNRARFDETVDQILGRAAQAPNTSNSATFQRALSELERTRTLLAALLGHAEPDDALSHVLDTAARYENSLIALKSLFIALAAVQPLVLLLEDVQALDDASTALLTELNSLDSSVPLAILLTARPTDAGRPPALLTEHGIDVELVRLQGLTATALRELATFWLGHPVGPALFKLLFEKANANPLMAQEILSYLQTSGALAFNGHRWHLGSDQIDLPPGISSILTARLDRLLPSVRELVQAAAVLGQECDTAVLAHMLERNIDGDLQNAADTQIFRRKSAVRVAFRHALLRDATYDLLGRAHRQMLHGRATAAIIATHPTDSPNYYSELAYHADQANLADQARHFARLAGEQATKRHDHRSAIRWLSSALDRTPPEAIADRYALLQLREDAYYLLGERSAQLADLDQLAQLAARLNPTSEADIAERKAKVALEMSDYQLTDTIAQQLIELGQRAHLPHGRAAGYRWRGEVAVRLGQFEQAKSYYESALRFAREAGDERRTADCLRGLGLIGDEQGYHREAEMYYSRVLDICRTLDDLNGEAATLNGLGNVARNMGDAHAARRYYRESLDCCETLGYRVGQGAVLGNLGNVALDLADFVSARTYLEASYTICTEIGFLEAAANTLDGLGVIEMETGQHVAAKRVLKSALREYEAISYQAGVSTAMLNLGINAYLLGDLTGAEHWLVQSNTLSRSIGDMRYAAQATNQLGFVALRRGQHAQAEAHFDDVLREATESDSPTIIAASRFGLGRVATTNGRLDEAHTYFDQSRKTFAALSRPHRAIESSAGLLDVALQVEDKTAVGIHTAALLDFVDTHRELHGTRHPYFVLLMLYKGLALMQHPAANDWLATGWQLLQARASDLERNQRQQYLNATAARRAIHTLWQTILHP